MLIGNGADRTTDTLTGARSYAVPGTGLRIAVTTPRSHPALWEAHLDGLDRLYAEHGVSDASQVDEDRTSLVFTAVDEAGEVVSGIRSSGPLASPEESQALGVWGGAAVVRDVLAGWIPDGLVETKGFWMARSFPGRRELLASIKRAPVMAPAVLGARWGMGTAAHTMRLFRAAGATVVDAIPPVPYPDARYRTSLAYWDRWHWAPEVQDAEIRAFDDDLAQLLEVRVPAPRAGS